MDHMNSICDTYIIHVIYQGMISLWDVDSELALAQIDECFNINDDGYSFAGALLGVGIANCNIKTDCDPVSSIYTFFVCSMISIF